MKVQVCTGKSCSAKFSKYIITRLENDNIFHKKGDIKIEKTLCMGDCKRGPNIKLNGQTYNYMGPAKASEIITK